MKNKFVVKSVGVNHPGNKNEADFFPVGTRIISIFGETADTEDSVGVFTGFGAEGCISALLPEQEQCYAVDFPLGVSIFLSPAELADNNLYQVIRRVIAHFKPMNQFCESDLYFDVTDKLLNGWSLFDIQHWEDCNCSTWLLLGNYTEDDGSHYGYVTASIKAYFGVSELSEITEEMLLVKRAECNRKADEQKGNFYNVHIYAVVRVKVPVVEAKNQPDAIKKAESLTDFHSLFNRGDKMEFADEIDCYLVDEVGDSDFLNSKWYKPDGITPLNEPKKAKLGLHRFMVTLNAPIESNKKIVFECEAEDIHHAITQAEVAYPTANISGAMSM